MKQILIFILLSLILSASKCKKEEDDCHYEITIMNNSNQDIIAALKFTNPDNKCILSGHVILPNENYKHSIKNCWEIRLSNSTPYDLYIVDTIHYNSPNVFYSCDSIEHYNMVLKHYVLTLDDLRSINFTITYP